MKYFFVAFALFISGCSVKHYTQSATKLLILKTPKIRFSDIAYIRHNQDGAIELELYVAGQMVNRFSINHLICVENVGCMGKASFNESYLTSSYPDTLLQNILLGKKIYKGLHVKQKKEGFFQLIKTKKVNIVYKVTHNQIYFKDRYNHILIKIKDVHYGK
jgi:hypothetical protein